MEYKKKAKGIKHRPKLPEFKEELGCFCHTFAYSNVHFNKIVNVDMKRFTSEPEYHE